MVLACGLPNADRVVHAIPFQPKRGYLPMIALRTLAMSLLAASALLLGCTRDHCDVGQTLVLLRLQPNPDLPAPDRLKAFWRVNGKQQTRPLQALHQGGSDRIGLCVDPDLTMQGSSELRLTVVGVDPNDAVTLGAELTLQLDRSDALPEQHVQLRQPWVCSSHGWCWLNPLPQGAGLAAVASRDPESAWAVGVAGTILHWNGGFWKRLEVPFSGRLNAVWVDEHDDAWVGGDMGRLYHCNNRSCIEVSTVGASGSVLALDGIDANTIYVAGPGGLRCGPMGCTPMQMPVTTQLNAVRVVDADTVLFAGNGGSLFRCFADRCTQIATETTKTLRAVQMDTAGTIYAAGDDGTFLVCPDGAQCVARDTGSTQSLQALHLTSTHHIFIRAPSSVLSCDDKLCRQISSASSAVLTGSYAASRVELWVAGYEQTGFTPGREISRGLILRCDESSCTRVLTLAETSSLSAVAGSGEDNVWTVGYPGVTAHCARASGCALRSSGPTWTLGGVSGDSDFIWAAGQQGAVARCDRRTGCTAVPSANLEWQWGSTGGTTKRIWAAGENGSLSTCTDGGCMRLDSGTGYGLRPTWPAGPAAAWIGGGGMTLLRCDAQICKPITTRVIGDLFTLWGTEPDRIWGAGAELAADRKSQHAIVIRCTTDGCTPVKIDPSPSNPESISGMSTDPDRVWVVGQGGMVLLCNGDTCQTLPAGSSEHLLSVYAASTRSAYAVGKNGTVLSCTESRCRTVASGTSQELVSVSGSGESLFWVTGGQAILLKCRDGSCTPLPPLTNVHYGPLLVPDSKSAWLVGGAGTVLRYDAALDTAPR